MTADDYAHLRRSSATCIRISTAGLAIFGAFTGLSALAALSLGVLLAG